MLVTLKILYFFVLDERLLWSVESRHGWNQFLPLSAAACQKYNQKECRTRCGPTSEQKSLLIHLLDRARSIVSAKQTIRYKLPLALEPSPNRWPEQNIAGYKSPQLDPSHIFSDIQFKCDSCKKMFSKKQKCNIINTLYDTVHI